MKNSFKLLTYCLLLILIANQSYSQVSIYDKETRKYGVINSEGKIIYKPKSEIRIDYLNGYARILENNKFGLIDSLGHIVIPPQYKNMFDYSEGLIGVKKMGNGDLLIQKMNLSSIISSMKVVFFVITKHGLNKGMYMVLLIKMEKRLLQ